MNIVATHRRLFLIMASVCLVLVLAALLIGIYAGDRILSALEMTDQAQWITSSTPGFAVFICAGALLCAVIGFVIAFTGLSNASMKSMAAGTIQSSRIRSFPCDEGYEHYLYSTVEYSVNGRQHQSEGSHRFSTNSMASAERQLAIMRPGDPVSVFYKPGDPEVIDLDVPPKDIWGSVLGGSLLGLIGLILLFLAGSSFTR